MRYLYHAVLKNMIGSTLYPLNSLATIYPAIYETEVKKYAHRPHVSSRRIPVLQNCLWNDVVFLTAVDPGRTKETLEKIDNNKKPTWRYFKINPEHLDPHHATVYLFKDADAHKPLASNDFEAFNTETLQSYAVIPEPTKLYWRQYSPSTERPVRLLYMHIPHILYRGPIDVSDAEIVEV